MPVVPDVELIRKRSSGPKARPVRSPAGVPESQRLYESLGVRDIAAYYGQPIQGQRFMEAVLN